MDDGLESSQSKTKRKMIALLSNYQWSYQYSIFCDVSDLEYEQAKDVAMSWIHDFDDLKLRDYLRKTSNTAILFSVRVHMIRGRDDKKRFPQIYLTMYCNDSLNLSGCERYFKNNIYPLNVMHKRLSKWKIRTTCNAIRTQALHDITSLDGKDRISTINKGLLIPKIIDKEE